MHTFLYTVLALILCVVSRSISVVRVLVIVLIVAIAQESFQMICESVPLGADEIFDMAVDLNGGLLGVGLYEMWQKKSAVG
jgi:VanZ family protein